MTITIHAQGAERKRLVKTISDWLGVPAKYCGAPTFCYEVDYFTIDRNGSLSRPARTTFLYRSKRRSWAARSLSGCSSTSTMKALILIRATPRMSLAAFAFLCLAAFSPIAIWKTSRRSSQPRAVLSRKPSVWMTCRWKSRTRRYPSPGSPQHPRRTR